MRKLMLGAGETFTELGGVSNVGSNFIGSSDAFAMSGESTESNGVNDTDNSLANEGVLGVEFEDEDEESYRSDSDGEVVCSKNSHVCFDPNNPIPHLELGMVFRGPKVFKIALAKYAVKNGLIL
ncbi:hypothetical protein Goari_026941 [Gossypium aridum]|uniref:Uncharacterized protein n=1 Tax=Gossypium aridum TaxID=34290 RepID=A0A7J8YU72_GOSAI|nr:hypothetical protein [Gossypium aridum]